MKLNENDAPDGYVAVEDDYTRGCDYCEVGYLSPICMKTRRCTPQQRFDFCDVIFKKKES